MKVVTYAIIEDHSIFRQGLKVALEPETWLHLMWEAESGNQGLEILRTENLPDVILLDIKMNNGDGIQLLKDIKAENINVKVIMLTMYEDEAYILHLLELGANGYLMKDSKAEDIIDAIIKVNENGFYFSEEIQQLMLRKTTAKRTYFIDYKPDIQLNDKEKKVLLFICKELTTVEIAERISLSPKRIEAIRLNLLNKIQARNTAGLVVYAIKKGLFLG